MVCLPDRRADAAPDEDDDEDGDKRLCPDCGGSGLGDDGNECETCNGSGPVPHNYECEAFENTQTHAEGLGPRSARRDNAATVAQQMRDHQNQMADIYNKLDYELSEKWRRS